jgi:hypothetical protein
VKYKVGDTLKHTRCVAPFCYLKGFEFVVDYIDSRGHYCTNAGNAFEEDEVELVKGAER